MAQTASTSEVRLPLMCKARHLAPLPLTPADARFAVCWGAGIPAPEGSLGYLISFTGKRTGRVVAWLRDGGYAYACDGYLAEPPADEPAIRLALWDNKPDAGCVRLRTASGELRTVSEFTRSQAGYAFVDPACDLGEAYTGTAVDYTVFLAVAYLAFRYLPRLAAGTGAAGRTMGEVLDGFTEVPVADAIDALVDEVARGVRTSGFERYAARILSDVDPVAFRRLTARHEVGLRRLGATGLFWISCDVSRMDDGEARLLVAVEGALNRLELIARAARDQGFDALAGASEGRCADEDWRIQRSIARQAPALLATVGKENPLLALRGVEAQRGGEWDVRTRLAAHLEHLVLPYRLVYRFAVNTEEGTATVVAWAPVAEAMPRWRRAAPGSALGTGGLAACTDHAAVAASAYALRLTAVLFAALFGAGAGVLRADVRLCADRALTRTVLTATLGRTGFVTALHERLRADALSDPALTWGVTALRDLLAPAHIELALDDACGLAPLPETGPFDPEPVRSVSVERDTRRLPPALAGLLHADTVAELDVFHLGDDPFAARVEAAAELARTDQRAAAQQLSDLLAVMEVMADIDDGEPAPGAPAAPAPAAPAAPAPEAPARRPLYCSSHLARLAMALVDPDPAARYRYVPDSAFEARVMLARLCIDNDDAAHGATYAREALELGPTSARAHVELASALMAQGEAARAAEVLKRSLAVDVLPASFTYTYYRLAFALWRLGDIDAAVACYLRALPNPQMHEAAAEELRLLMAEAGRTRLPEEDAARAALERAGVPAAPAEPMVDLAARVVVAACDAGLLNVAALYAHVMAPEAGSDIVSAALMSLAPWRAPGATKRS